MADDAGNDGGDRWRVILHVDMDAFFASVEVLDDPRLAGLPVIVGGDGARGVVAACTYEARRYGVHSAMPSAVARRLCPGAVFVAGRYERYSEESSKLHAVLQSVTPLVEGISLDEAFVDVTGAVGAGHPWPDGGAVARFIRERVAHELCLTCSVGVGRSKFIAKLASKAAKPAATRTEIRPGAGVVVVSPGEELAFLHPLPVRALWGVGPVTERRLSELGVVTVGDIVELPPGSLSRYVGPSHAAHLEALARAEDERPVVPEREAKSIGHEETFRTDLWDGAELRRKLVGMVDASAAILRREVLAARTVTVKLRFGDFTTLTRSHSMNRPIDTTPAIAAVATALLDSVYLDRGVRLLGVSLSGLGAPGIGQQLAFDLGGSTFESPNAADAPGDETVRGIPVRAGSGVGTIDHRPTGGGAEAARLQESWQAVTAAVDAIRARYGGASVGPASLVGPDGLDVRRRGAAQWGPSNQNPASE